MFGFPEIVPKKSFFFAPFGRLEKQNPTKFSSRGSFTAYHHKNNSLLQSELRMSMLFLEVLLAISESESLIIPSDTSDSEFSASFSSESDSSSESTVMGSTPSPSNRISESRLPLSGRESPVLEKALLIRLGFPMSLTQASPIHCVVRTGLHKKLF